MKIFKKIILFLVVSLMALILKPCFSHATSTSVDSESALLEALSSVEDGDVITISQNIALTRPVEINNNKNFTIHSSQLAIKLHLL